MLTAICSPRLEAKLQDESILEIRMFKKIILALVMLTGLALYAFNPSFAKDPAISPDGTQVCFVYQNDLWLVSFKGGDARRLTFTEANEWSPIWSPDGKYIAFNSIREGQNYVYLMPSSGGASRVVIRESYSISDWFADGSALLGSRHNFPWGSSMYKIPLDGSRPTMLAEIGHPFASLSPDNSKIIFNRRGDPYRESYQGSINGELWLVDTDLSDYVQLTNTPFTERYPRFSMHSNSVFYCASDGARFQLYRVDNMDFSRPFQVTQFDTWSARDISIARQNDRIVFERFDQIWKYDPTSIGGSRVSQLEINIPADLWEDKLVRTTVTNDVYSYSVSDDELLALFSHRYDIFAVPKKGGEARQITFDHAGVENIGFLPDGRTAILNRMYKGINTLFKVKIDSLMIIEPIEWFGKDIYHVDSVSRDVTDRWIINYTNERMAGNIAVADSMFENISSINNENFVSSGLSISPDGKYAVYASIREDIWIRELFLHDFETGISRKIMNDDTGIGWIHWLPDYKSILFTRNGDIFRLDFEARDEFELEKDYWQEVLTQKVISKKVKEDKVKRKSEEADELESEAADDEADADEEVLSPLPSPRLKVQWDDIEKRVYPILTQSANYLYVIKVIDDSTFYYLQDGFVRGNETIVKRANIYGNNVKEKKKLGKNVGQFQLVKNNLYYLENGIIKSYNLASKATSEKKIGLDYTFDKSILNRRVFEQVWGAFGLNFYDRDMHGKNWKEVYDLYSPFLDKAESIYDIEAIVNEMIGDVNASHTGFYPRDDKSHYSVATASLGLEFDYYVTLQSGIRVLRVYPQTRLHLLYGIKAGDTLTHIDGVSITPYTTIDSLLADKVGKRIRLVFKRGEESINAQMDGLSRRDHHELHYKFKTAERKALVDELSAGRLGYVHIPAMGTKDYDNFIRDVFKDNADKEALVIDVRGNSGGRIHDLIATFLLKKHYGFSTSRRMSVERRLEPRRIWYRPSIVLVDEASFSDGEIFPIIYQELKLGKVIGMPSSGSVIGTWQYDLIDGSSMRMPGSGWYKLDGTNMEGTGAMPDILVDLTPNDIIQNRDVQLIRAIEEILQDLDNE